MESQNKGGGERGREPLQRHCLLGKLERMPSALPLKVKKRSERNGERCDGWVDGKGSHPASGGDSGAVQVKTGWIGYRSYLMEPKIA